MWWQGTEQKLHYASYKVGSTTVMVGTRPNLPNSLNTTPEFYRSVDAWMNVSETFTPHDKGVVNVFLPWYEMGQPTIENIYSAMKTLNHWIDVQKLDKIYLHCDLGTHRAVTFFGFYLLAYHKEDANEIENAYQLSEGRRHWSSPIQYANTYIKEMEIGLVPGLSKLLDFMKNTTENNQELSFNDILDNKIEGKYFKEYYNSRLFKVEWPNLVYRIKEDLKYLGKEFWTLNYRFLMNKVHKKLNTKHGKALKRMGL